jgi:hypothetical protein
MNTRHALNVVTEHRAMDELALDPVHVEGYRRKQSRTHEGQLCVETGCNLKRLWSTFSSGRIAGHRPREQDLIMNNIAQFKQSLHI